MDFVPSGSELRASGEGRRPTPRHQPSDVRGVPLREQRPRGKFMVRRRARAKSAGGRDCIRREANTHEFQCKQKACEKTIIRQSIRNTLLVGEKRGLNPPIENLCSLLSSNREYGRLLLKTDFNKSTVNLSAGCECACTMVVGRRCPRHAPSKAYDQLIWTHKIWSICTPRLPHNDASRINVWRRRAR